MYTRGIYISTLVVGLRVVIVVVIRAYSSKLNKRNLSFIVLKLFYYSGYTITDADVIALGQKYSL